MRINRTACSTMQGKSGAGVGAAAKSEKTTRGEMQNKVLKLDSKDNVLIALADPRQGEQISFESQSYTLKSDVPAKHKFATEALAAGASMIMYGVLVGKAAEPIWRGGLLTTRNIHHQAAAFQEKTEEYRWTAPDVSPWRQREFLRYRRSDGQVGTRN